MIKKIFIYLFSPTPDFKLLKLINSESDILNKHLVAFFGSRCPFIDDNKKNNIISKYFSNQKICDSNIKQYKNYSKISGNYESISNRKNNHQNSFVSKIYQKDKKLNKSINRSTLNKRPCSKDYY